MYAGSLLERLMRWTVIADERLPRERVLGVVFTAEDSSSPRPAGRWAAGPDVSSTRTWCVPTPRPHWCGRHGALAEGEIGSSDGGAGRRKWNKRRPGDFDRFVEQADLATLAARRVDPVHFGSFVCTGYPGGLGAHLPSDLEPVDNPLMKKEPWGIGAACPILPSRHGLAVLDPRPTPLVEAFASRQEGRTPLRDRTPREALGGRS